MSLTGRTLNILGRSATRVRCTGLQRLRSEYAEGPGNVSVWSLEWQLVFPLFLYVSLFHDQSQWRSDIITEFSDRFNFFPVDWGLLKTLMETCSSIQRNLPLNHTYLSYKLFLGMIPSVVVLYSTLSSRLFNMRILLWAPNYRVAVVFPHKNRKLSSFQIFFGKDYLLALYIIILYGLSCLIHNIIIHSKYFPVSDWLKTTRIIHHN